MPEAFFSLSLEDRRSALGVAADRSGRPVHLLEKDVWVVWALENLFSAPFGDDLVFKGGTSLSKGYQAIARFSEDVDLTYDIRVIASDLIALGSDGLPANPTQARNWTKEITKRLGTWNARVVAPLLQRKIAETQLPAAVATEGGTATVKYEPLAAGTGYVRPEVLLEFGARSTGEPSEPRSVTCDAAAYLADLAFPSATPSVMRPERTFWEKATAIHVVCLGGKVRGGERFSRHWYDIVSLEKLGYATAAFADRSLASHVAKHKNAFFREKDADGDYIDYEPAVAGGLRLVPVGSAYEGLERDYTRMVEDGLFLDTPLPFQSIVERCQALQEAANAQTSL